MIRPTALAMILLAAPATGQAPRPPLFDGLYAPGAVLQRDRPILVRGRALAGERVTVALADARVTVTADRTGDWTATLPARPAGGPHILVATTPAGAREQLDDVMVGDVWLCSGQSNMELGVDRALDSRAVLEAARDDRIRLLTVAKATAPLPLAQFPVQVRWQPATPESVRPFSAACWFMARAMRRAADVPIGLVNASWGGTVINAWRSEAAIARAGDERDGLAILRAYRADPADGNRRFGETWGRWWRERSGDAEGAEPWNEAGAERLTWAPVPSLTAWEGWGVPELAAFNGMVWYRTTATLTADQARRPATLEMGWVDEIDQSFVNGHAVGSSYGPSTPRRYPLAPGTLRAGTNAIVVNVLDSYATGGLVGPPEQRRIRFADGSSVPLGPGWEYSVVAPGSSPPRAPWDSNGGLAGIANAMIAPIRDYGLAGIAWYQGESDAGRAAGYRVRLESLIDDWRRQFDRSDLPVLVVQLAGYGPASAVPVESGFADIREAQRLAVAADRHAGLVVATDIGSRTDIHPADKQTVGERLARAAARLGRPDAAGPAVATASRTGAAVLVRFVGVTGSLASLSGRPIGFELCGRAPASCRFVDAAIAEHGAVRLADARPDDARVRFCWGDSPQCNLTDETGLPAGPFEIAIGTGA